MFANAETRLAGFVSSVSRMMQLTDWFGSSTPPVSGMLFQLKLNDPCAGGDVEDFAQPDCPSYWNTSGMLTTACPPPLPGPAFVIVRVRVSESPTEIPDPSSAASDAFSLNCCCAKVGVEKSRHHAISAPWRIGKPAIGRFMAHSRCGTSPTGAIVPLFHRGGTPGPQPVCPRTAPNTFGRTSS